MNQNDCGELCISFNLYSFFEINNFFLIYSFNVYLCYICSAPYAYIGPLAYGTSRMRILIWDAHTCTGQHFVPYKYFICMFYFFTGLWILLL